MRSALTTLVLVLLALAACERPRPPPPRARRVRDAAVASVPRARRAAPVRRDAGAARTAPTDAGGLTHRPPDPAFLEAGRGFHCFGLDTGRETIESCFRHRDECEVARESMAEIGAEIPACSRRPSAFCLTYREGAQPGYSCFLPSAHCDGFRRDLLTQNRGQRAAAFDQISDCAELR